MKLYRSPVALSAILFAALLLSPLHASADQRKLRGEFFNEFGSYRQAMSAHFMRLLDPPKKEEPSADSAYNKRRNKRKARRAAKMARMRSRLKDPAKRARIELDQLKEHKAMLERIDKACTTKYKGITDDPVHQDQKWAVWCKIAADREAMLKLYVTRKVASVINTTRDTFRNELANLDDSDGTLKLWDQKYYRDPAAARTRVLKQYLAQLKFVGINDTAELFAEVDKALAELLAAVEKKSAGWKFKKEGKPSKDAFVRKTYKQTFKGIKIKKIFETSGGWQVTRNNLGVILYRKKSGKIFFKLPSEKWCREDRWYYVQDYKGGKYGKSYVEHSPAEGFSRIVSCK